MKLLTILFAVNAALLLLHEIESAYEKEWEILKLPGNISGFLLLHIPVILLLFYGLLEIEKLTYAGLVLGIITGACGILPFIVHKLIVNRKDKFNRITSNIIIYLNIISGTALFIFSLLAIY